eukprot:SAG31_NODE_1271_length_9064_cov_10.148912_5_plen_161_part_00
MLRIKLIEELEVPYQARFQQLHQELELSRDQFYAARRESAMIKEEHDNAAAMHIKEIESLRNEYEMRCDDLRNRIRSMQTIVDDKKVQEVHASLQRENNELKANIKNVRVDFRLRFAIAFNDLPLHACCLSCLPSLKMCEKSKSTLLLIGKDKPQPMRKH